MGVTFYSSFDNLLILAAFDFTNELNAEPAEAVSSLTRQIAANSGPQLN